MKSIRSLRIALFLTLASPALALTACASTSLLSTEGTSATASEATSPASDATTAFLEWQGVQQFIDAMVAKHGFNRAELESFFTNARFVESAIQLMKPAPPGRPKNWQAYRDRFVEPIRIAAGTAFWKAHAEALARAEATSGVPAEIIVGIIGVETMYGRYTGKYRVPDALATLAFFYPETHNRAARMDYFRGEVENLLLLARDARVAPFSLLGSYAGAIGLPQFMPGSIRQYAVDFDGDGQIDLRHSPVDAIGSVANYLAEHGWRKEEPLVYPTRVDASTDEWKKFLDQGLTANFTPDELRQGGLILHPRTPSNLRYGLVDLQNGNKPTEYWLGTHNFFAVTHYNRSYFYAMAVITLGEAVKANLKVDSAVPTA